MQTIRYPREQMHRIAYTKLTERQIAGGDDAIAIYTDGTASARVPCIVTTATPIESCGTLVEMARLQGDGLVVRSERRALVSAFVKRDGVCKFESAKLEAQA